MIHRRLVAVLFTALILLPSAASAQHFGKNKLRARTHSWSVLTTEHFDIHFYDSEKDAALKAAEMAEEIYGELSAVLGHTIAKRVPVILYATHSDFQETNALSGLIDVGTGGVTEFLRRRVILPFTGSFGDFHHVLKHELVHAFQIDILFGGEGRDRLNPLTFRMPLWLMEGMAEHLSVEGPDAQTAMWISDGCHTGGLPSIEQMWWVADIRAYRYGQSLWGSISAARGDSVCGNVLREIVASRDVKVGVEKALGLSVGDLSDEWVDAMRCEYLPLVAEREEPRKFARRVAGGSARERLALSPAISPDGERFAYFSDRDLTMSLFVGDVATGKTRRLIEGETSGGLEELRTFHSSLAWSPDGASLAFTAKGAGEEALLIVDAESGRTTRHVLRGIGEVRSPAFSPDGTRIAVIGVSGGVSDLYLFELESRRVERVTNDHYAERSPAFSPDGRWIAFTTDEPEVSGAMFGADRLALLDLDSRITERVPALGSKAASPVWDAHGDKIFFTADPDGFSDIFIYRLADRSFERATHILTGIQGILPTSACLSISADGEKVLFSALEDAAYGIYLATNLADRAVPYSVRTAATPIVAETAAAFASEDEVLLASNDMRPVTPRAEPSPSTDAGEREPSEKVSGSAPAGIEYDPDIYDENTIYASTFGLTPEPRAPPQIRRYRPRFAPEFVLGGGAVGSGGGAVGASQVGFSDLLGDHRIRLGLGIYGSLKNSDIAVAYENWTHTTGYGVSTFWHTNRYRRIDDRLTISEESELYAGATFELFHPVSKFTRLEASLALGEMNELFRTRSYALTPIEGSDERHRFASVGVAYVNDTVVWGMTGPVKGRRVRFSAERSQGDIQVWTLRADARRYWRPAHSLTLASRVVAGVRDGRLAENWHLGNTILVHGLQYGELTGTRMAVANFEARFPFIRALALNFPAPITFRDIGGSLFLDAGAAWTDEFTNGGTNELAARYGNLLGAYGAGMRANIGFGVLMLDLAQRTNFTTTFGKPRLYTTLGVEF
ncbi:MAG: BamA/TamA family outer membrane protein [bacterium]